jgi:hypothetical protein
MVGRAPVLRQRYLTPGRQRQPVTLHLRHATIRANPRYKLVPFDRLPAAEQAALADLCQDPDFYGVLMPDTTPGEVKAVCRETALLVLTLLQPGPVPGYVMRSATWETDLLELILDGVLEVEAEGGFQSGAAAAAISNQPPPVRQGHIGRLSFAALQYGEALGITKVADLSARLYNFGRLPATPEWRRTIPTSAALLAYVGIDSGGQAAAQLPRDWVMTARDGWVHWASRTAETSLQPARGICKLYVSPQPSCLAEAFAAAVSVFTERRVPAFKLGADLYGILRPDKLVAYLSSPEELQAVAERLEARLAGCPAQGVPFTAALESTGLLSWGMDPPRLPSLSWSPLESWRLWVTNHLATALIAARLAPADGLAPWEFALARIRLADVDPQTWAPLPSLWQNLPDPEG